MQYQELLPTMIKDWRTRWADEFSFYIVQLAEFGHGFEGFLGGLERGRTLLKFAPGQVGDLFAGFLDDLGVGLFLNEGFTAILRHEAESGGEGEDEQRPTGGVGQPNRHEPARVNLVRVGDGVMQHEFAPGAGVIIAGAHPLASHPGRSGRQARGR
jgi:hypothetical protein